LKDYSDTDQEALLSNISDHTAVTALTEFMYREGFSAAEQ
jgi:hypothetical protein